MWLYEKKLEYPVNITKKDLKMAQYIIAQFGGPSGELGAALQYLTQRFNMPDDRGKALLTDIGTEEIGHCEMICAMYYQLINGATIEELKEAGLADRYATYGKSLFPTDSTNNPFTTNHIKVTGDYMADLENDLAAEENARATYEALMNLTDNPEVLAPLSFLRQREIIHYHRFKELRDYYLAQKK